MCLIGNAMTRLFCCNSWVESEGAEDSNPYENNRFHGRKASGPAALNISNAAANTLQVKHFMMQQSNDRLSNFESN